MPIFLDISVSTILTKYESTFHIPGSNIITTVNWNTAGCVRCQPPVYNILRFNIKKIVHITQVDPTIVFSLL